jgi:hypothetical protein
MLGVAGAKPYVHSRAHNLLVHGSTGISVHKLGHVSCASLRPTPCVCVCVCVCCARAYVRPCLCVCVCIAVYGISPAIIVPAALIAPWAAGAAAHNLAHAKGVKLAVSGGRDCSARRNQRGVVCTSLCAHARVTLRHAAGAAARHAPGGVPGAGRGGGPPGHGGYGVRRRGVLVAPLITGLYLCISIPFSPSPSHPLSLSLSLSLPLPLPLSLSLSLSLSLNLTSLSHTRLSLYVCVYVCISSLHRYRVRRRDL